MKKFKFVLGIPFWDTFDPESNVFIILLQKFLFESNKIPVI